VHVHPRLPVMPQYVDYLLHGLWKQVVATRVVGTRERPLLILLHKWWMSLKEQM
jgi:hypothetical protein